MRTLRGVTWSILSSAFGIPLALAVSIVLARVLGPIGLARFAFLTFLVPLLFSSSDLGFGQATARAVSRSFASGDLEQTRVLVSKALGWNLVRIPILAGIVVVIARPGPLAALAFGVYLVLSQAASGLSFSLDAENRTATKAKIVFAQALGSGGAAIGAAVAGASPTTVWAASLAASAISAPVFLLVANPALRRAGLTPRLPSQMPPGFWRFGFGALAFSLVYLLVFSRSEIIALQALGRTQALAVFALAYGLAQRLTTPVDTILGPLTSGLAALEEAHPDRFRDGFDRALRICAAGVALVAGTVVIGTAFVAPLLFGPRYTGVAAAFLALAGASLLQSAAQPFMAFAYAVGRPDKALGALTVALAVDMALAFSLTAVLGLWGAVIANVTAGVFAIGLIARLTAGPASLSRAGVPVRRLVLLAIAACSVAYGAGALVGGEGTVAGAVTAFVAGTTTFLVLSRATGGLLLAGDREVLLAHLASRLLRSARAMWLLRLAL